jgi:hypothetical protein
VATVKEEVWIMLSLKGWGKRKYYIKEGEDDTAK